MLLASSQIRGGGRAGGSHSGHWEDGSALKPVPTAVTHSAGLGAQVDRVSRLSLVKPPHVSFAFAL